MPENAATTLPDPISPRYPFTIAYHLLLYSHNILVSHSPKNAIALSIRVDNPPNINYKFTKVTLFAPHIGILIAPMVYLMALSKHRHRSVAYYLVWS